MEIKCDFCDNIINAENKFCPKCETQLSVQLSEYKAPLSKTAPIYTSYTKEVNQERSYLGIVGVIVSIGFGVGAGLLVLALLSLFFNGRYLGRYWIC